MLPKPLPQIGKADLASLIENQVSEGKTLEYKLTLPAGNDDARKEFLADVCSFANTAGGDMIFGVQEGKDKDGKNTGLPTAVRGIAGLNFDAERLRLDSMIRDGLDPVFGGAEYQKVEGFDDGPVLVLRLPRSWMSPHMVTFKNTSRFYARNSAGKFQLDVDSIRAAFLSTAAIPDRLRRVRTERLARILAGETPVPMMLPSKYVLHVVSFASLAGSENLAESIAKNRLARVPPIGHDGCNHRRNFDGLVTYSQNSDRRYTGYAQFFRSGLVEFVTDRVIDNYPREGKVLAGRAVEDDLINTLRDVLPALAECGQSSPVFAAATFAGVQGARIAASHGQYTLEFDRDVLTLPEIQFDALRPSRDEIARALRPAFDVLWQAAGSTRSYNYDEDGNRLPR